MANKLKPNNQGKSSTAFKKLRSDLRDTINEALSLGNLAIMPPRNDGSKMQFPKSWKQFQETMPTQKQLSDWYNDGELTGFGLICGAISDNLECLDIDNHKIYERFCKRMRKVGLSRLLKKLQKGYVENTPNGVHFLYRCSEIGRSMKLATKPGNKSGEIKNITLIEIKGEGGLIICAPTYGEVNLDGEYKLVSGSLSTIPRISPDEREDLHNVARSFHIEEKEEFVAEVEKITFDTRRKAGRPGDDFNDRAQWADILVGWVEVYKNKGVTYLRRPGKDGGISATINYQGKDLFHNFSSSTPFELKSYDKFGAYATLNHNRDLSIAAKQLILDGYGGSEVGVQNESDEFAKTLALSCFPEIPFPLDILPKYFRRLVNKYSNALQCPSEFIAMSFMTIISGAAGNAVILKLKNSWQAVPFIWFGIIDATGSGKSHPIDAAMKPLHRLQAAETIRYEKEMSDKKKGNDKASQTDTAQIRHYYSMNFTIEALTPIFKTSPQGIVIYVDELAGLIKSFNQYKRKGSDTEQFLTLYNGGPLKSDRKIGSGASPESGAAVIGGIQPEVFSHVFSNIEHENGLAYRFLPMPLNFPPPLYSHDDLSEEDEQEWDDLVVRMSRIPVSIDSATGRIVKFEFILSDVGKADFEKFHNELSKWQPFMPIRFSRYLPKLKTYCLKFMAVLHLIKCYKGGELTEDVNKSTVEGAIELTRYFAGQALKLTLSASKEGNGDAHADVFKKALISLKDKVKNGKLLLKCVRNRVNELLPPELELSEKDKSLGAWLRKQGLVLKEGTANKMFVHWNDDILG